MTENEIIQYAKSNAIWGLGIYVGGRNSGTELLGLEKKERKPSFFGVNAKMAEVSNGAFW